MLGSTPFVLGDVPAHAHRKFRRNNSIHINTDEPSRFSLDSISSSDGGSSPDSDNTSRKAQRVEPRPLCIRVIPSAANSVPCSPTPLNGSFDLPSPSLSCPPTPITPKTPTAQDIAAIRRKRILKVSRTLGEQVPPSLVTLPDAKGQKELERLRKRRALSLSIPRVQPKAKKEQHPVAVPELDKTDVEWNRRNMAEVQKKLRAMR